MQPEPPFFFPPHLADAKLCPTPASMSRLTWAYVYQAHTPNLRTQSSGKLFPTALNGQAFCGLLLLSDGRINRLRIRRPTSKFNNLTQGCSSTQLQELVTAEYEHEQNGLQLHNWRAAPLHSVSSAVALGKTLASCLGQGEQWGS